MKKAYNITISNGVRENTFTLLAKNRHEAHEIAHIAHMGTGWRIIRTKPSEKTKNNH